MKNVWKTTFPIVAVACVGVFALVIIGHAAIAPAPTAVQKPISALTEPNQGLPKPLPPTQPPMNVEKLMEQDGCVTPQTGMVITEDTVLCPGTYQFDGPNETAFIYIGADDVTLTCDNTTLQAIFPNPDLPITFAVSSVGYDNVTIKNCHFNSFFEPIHIENADTITITKNILDNHSYAITIAQTTNSYFAYNTITNAINDAFHTEVWQYTTGSSDNTIEHNTISNASRGIFIANDCHHNTIYKNLFDNIETNSIEFWRVESGAPTAKASDTMVEKNVFDGPGLRGITFRSNAADNTTIKQNIFKQKEYTSFRLYGDNLNTLVYGNTFLDNPNYHAYDAEGNATYSNNGQGNYWAGFSETCADADNNGVCDNAYTEISGNVPRQDDYPLTNGLPIVLNHDPVTTDETDWAFINVPAYDNDINALTYSADLPGFSSMALCWPNRPDTLGWQTGTDSAGTYEVTYSADDGEYSDSETVTVQVDNTCRLNKWGQMVCSNVPANITCY